MSATVQDKAQLAQLERSGGKEFSETMWLRAEIADAENTLAGQRA